MLEEIKTNIEKLISHYETEKSRADGLAAELAAAKAELEASKARARELDAQIDNLRLQIAFSGAGDPAEAKARITKLIREIDRCIKLLES